jgi:septal ring factor EnvC (AmiA/AmiB activator)
MNLICCISLSLEATKDLDFRVMNIWVLFCKSFLALIFVVSFAAIGFAQEGEANHATVKERELENIRGKISAIKQSMDKRAADRDRITSDLQRTEVQISEKHIRLKEIESRRQVSREKKMALEQMLKVREEELKVETVLLAAQAHAAYTSGHQERIKLLLNQQEPATAGRMMIYYSYLIDYRDNIIDKVERYISELDALQQKMAKEANRLSTLVRARYDELIELNHKQDKRQKLLAMLKIKIEQEGNEIERLAAEGKDLARLITELMTILPNDTIGLEKPFSRLRGQLAWPVAGGLIHNFGQPRAGGRLKWNGVVLAAPRGREVRAVYHGRVVFADWLAGMGLLVIVDHGEGFMTLYGYNETILKTGGEWVVPGDVIATVGDSGGQQQAGLYFEIRQGTRPIDPRRWINKLPKTS